MNPGHTLHLHSLAVMVGHQPEHEAKIRTGVEPGALAPNENDVDPQAPAGRKVSVLGVEVVDRGTWSGPLDFLMSMIAYAVGLGGF